MNRRERRERRGKQGVESPTIRICRIVGDGKTGNSRFSRLTKARLAWKYFIILLQFASVAGRRAVSQKAALAYFTGFPMEHEVDR